MQNVACAIATVQIDSSIPRMVRKAVRNASAVTMPGSAIGSTTSSDSVCRPKNEYRPSANASSVPSTSAMAVAISPTSSDVTTAARTPSLPSALDHQCIVKPRGGHAKTVLTLNELTSTTSSGT